MYNFNKVWNIPAFPKPGLFPLILLFYHILLWRVLDCFIPFKTYMIKGSSYDTQKVKSNSRSTILLCLPPSFQVSLGSMLCVLPLVGAVESTAFSLVNWRSFYNLLPSLCSLSVKYITVIFTIGKMTDLYRTSFYCKKINIYNHLISIASKKVLSLLYT